MMIGTANTASQRRRRSDGRKSTARSQWARALLVCTIAWVGFDTQMPSLGSENPPPSSALSAPSSAATLLAPERESAVPPDPSAPEAGQKREVEYQPFCGQDDIGSFARRFELLLAETERQRSQKLDDLRTQVEALAELLGRTTEHRQAGGHQSTPPQGDSGTGDKSPADPDPSSSVPSLARPPDIRDSISALADGTGTADSLADRLALANNLFGAGDVELALELYHGLQKEGLKDDEQRWVRYQIATCHRRLGSVATAEQIYREVGSASGEDLTSTNARWWLDALGRHKRLDEGLKGLDQAIQTMEREIRESSDD